MSYTIDATMWRSPNHGERTGPIESVVVHSCEGQWPSPRVSSLPWLCNPKSEVSCHYYICRDTTIFQLVDDDRAAWHAGVALPRFDNASSIGVECEHRSGQNWPADQQAALAWLLRQLIARYHIPLAAVETHGQIAIKGPYKRKTDPTNWPHDAFVRWRGALIVGSYRAITCAPVFQDRRPDAPLALTVSAGTVEPMNDLTNGWLHFESEAGFSPLSCWEQV